MVVLGGNAFAGSGRPLTMDGQFQFAHDVLAKLEPVLASDCPVVLTHGNGPQVGQMLTRVEVARDDAYRLPLEVCVAETEGELGYVLQQSLYNVFADLGKPRPIVSLLTQVVVDEQDPAFKTPTKPIGRVLQRQEADELQSEGIAVREEAGRGFRRLVPSPKPLEIIESDVIRSLLEAGVVVIAAGGGGVPVIRSQAHLRGVDAVVDKDLASALLGVQLGATEMIIVTDVPCAYRDYRTSAQTAIGRIDVATAKQLMKDGHFAPGSMLPKIEAACRFCGRPETRVVICSPNNLLAALAGEAGTIVTGPADSEGTGAA